MLQKELNGIVRRAFDRKFNKDATVNGKNFIEAIANDKELSVKFNIQNGPIKEVGKNGVQISDIINFTHAFISFFNDQYPHPENIETLKALTKAREAQERRTIERKNRDVEGKSKV